MSALVLYNRQPLDEQPANVYLKTRQHSERGRKTQAACLDAIANQLIGTPDPSLVDWGKLRLQHTSRIKSMFLEARKPNGKPYAPSYINKHLSALRGVLGIAYGLNQISGDDYRKAISVEGVKNDRDEILSGRALSIGEVTALIEACTRDASPAGFRDASIISLLYATGLRRSEVVSLNLEDYEPDAQMLRFVGKGNRIHENPVMNGTEHALQDWLKIRGMEPGPLYTAINKSGKVSARRMTPQAIYKMLRKRAAQAKVNDFSPHDIRRTFISEMLELNDLSTVSKLAGHKNPETTARYDRRGTKAKKDAVNRLFVPYAGRDNG